MKRAEKQAFKHVLNSIRRNIWIDESGIEVSPRDSYVATSLKAWKAAEAAVERLATEQPSPSVNSAGDAAELWTIIDHYIDPGWETKHVQRIRELLGIVEVTA